MNRFLNGRCAWVSTVADLTTCVNYTTEERFAKGPPLTAHARPGVF
jgi:hypothetical protein